MATRQQYQIKTPREKFSKYIFQKYLVLKMGMLDSDFSINTWIVMFYVWNNV